MFVIFTASALAQGSRTGAIMTSRDAVGQLRNLCTKLRRKRRRIGIALHDIRCDPVANRMLDLLMHDFTVAEEKSRLVLTKKTGDLKLFVHELDDLRQLDFIHNQAMARQIDRLRMLLTASNEHRQRWKVRALMAEAQVLEAVAKTGKNGVSQKAADAKYAALKRFLAKRFHPDYAPAQGIEKLVRNEIFKEIWHEIERLDEKVSASDFATAASRRQPEWTF